MENKNITCGAGQQENGKHPIATTRLVALDDDLQRQLHLLNQQKTEQLLHRADDTLRHALDQVNNLETKLLEAKTTKNARDAMANILSEEIVKACDGNLAVPHYSQRAKAEQQVLLYDGTHWQVLPQQRFYDFVNEAAQHAGLSDNERHKPSFMNRIYEQVAFGLAHHRENAIPKREAWVNLCNGTLEIGAEGKLNFREHRRNDFFQYVLPYAYNPEATCPQWQKFLNQMLPDPDTQKVLAEYLGYCFTYDIKAEKMLVFYGNGSNGKSVVMDVMEALFGSENVSCMSLADLTTSDEKRAMIEDKLVNISHESELNINASTMKQLVSGEAVDVRRLYENTRKMDRYAKLITSFNVLPRAEATNGFYRRFLIIPFKVTIDERDADLDLAHKLCNELPGILNWVLAALPDFVKRQAFTHSEECIQALKRYRLQSDSVRLFVEEQCSNDEECTSGKQLFDAYKLYCIDNGHKYCGKQLFFDRLEAAGHHRVITNKQVFFNLKLNDHETDF